MTRDKREVPRPSAKLVLEPLEGEDIILFDVAKHAAFIAEILGVCVTFRFGGISHIIEPGCTFDIAGAARCSVINAGEIRREKE